jgi:hypothetical protein
MLAVAFFTFGALPGGAGAGVPRAIIAEEFGHEL